MEEQADKLPPNSLLDDAGISSIPKKRTGRRDRISKKEWGEKCLLYLKLMEARIEALENDVEELTEAFLLYDLADDSPPN